MVSILRTELPFVILVDWKFDLLGLPFASRSTTAKFFLRSVAPFEDYQQHEESPDHDRKRCEDGSSPIVAVVQLPRKQPTQSTCNEASANQERYQAADPLAID